jgi:hypothetical protein
MKKLIFIVMAALFAFTLNSEGAETKYAKVYCKAKFIRLRKGLNINDSSKEKPSFEKIPKEFDGRKITLYTTGSSDPLEFKVKEAGTVTLLATGPNKGNLYKEGWIKVGDVVINAPKGPLALSLLQKELDVGEYSMPIVESVYGVRLIK